MASADDRAGGGGLAARLVAALDAHDAATVVRWKRYGLWQTVSGRDMAARIRAIGSGLRTLGLQDGDVAAVIGDNCYEWVLADIGTMAAGGVSAGFDAHADATELARLLNQTRARFLFVAGDDQLHKAMAVMESCPALARIIVMHQQWDGGARAENVVSLAAVETSGVSDDAELPQARPSDAPVAIIYSSGVTGPARGAVLSHAALVAQAGRAAAALGLRSDDERLSLSPIHHVLERVIGIYAALIAGTVINFSESRDTALANLAELQPTVIQASPQVWARLRSSILLILADVTPFQRWACRVAFALAAKPSTAFWQSPLRLIGDRLVLAPIRARLGLARARLCLSVGAGAQDDVLAWFGALGRDLVDVYGHAEAGGAVSIALPAFAGAGGIAVTLGEGGEILLRADGLCSGYADGGDMALSAEGWWRSGDVGARDAAGALRVAGRIADVLHTSRGERIAPYDSERALQASPDVAAAFLHLDRDDNVCAKILIDFDNVVKFAQDRSIPFTHFQSLCRASEIRTLVEGIVTDANRSHPAVRIAAFSLIERPLGPGHAEVSPMLTLRRYMFGEGHAGQANHDGQPERLELVKN